MNRPRAKAAGLISLGVAAVALFSGCDLNENADTDKGRDLFIANCGTCHYLNEAGTTGNLGPDLDAAFAASRNAGMDQDTIEGVVTDQISHPRQTDPSRPLLHAARTSSPARTPTTSPPTSPRSPACPASSLRPSPAAPAARSTPATAAAAVTRSRSPARPAPSARTSTRSSRASRRPQIEESIVDPNKEIVQGFQPNVMPSNYSTTIDPAGAQGPGRLPLRERRQDAEAVAGRVRASEALRRPDRRSRPRRARRASGSASGPRARGRTRSRARRGSPPASC